jgi:hypothetical protein
LFLALLLRVANGVRRGLHAGVDLPLEPDLRAIVDARGADEEADLARLQMREAQPGRVDQRLAQLVCGPLRRVFLGEVLPSRFVEDVERRAAAAVAGHDGVREPLPRLGGDDLADVAEQLVEERPAVFGLDALELLDVDEDDPDLAVVDEDLFDAVEDDRQRRQRGGAVEQGRLEGRPPGLHFHGPVFAAALEDGLDALEHLVAVERFDEVIVGADLQTGEPVFHIAAAGDQDHSDVRGALDAAQGLADLPAAALRHHHVEEDDVRKLGLGQRQRFLAVAGEQDFAVERAEVHPQQMSNFLIIVGNEHDRRGHNLRRMIAENRPEV